MIFKAKVEPIRGQSAATMFELIYHTAVHNVRIGHQSPIIGLVLSMLQTIMMVAGFYVMFSASWNQYYFTVKLSVPAP